MSLLDQLKKLQNGGQHVKQQAVLLSLVGMSQMAYAGGDSTFQEGIDWLLGLMQGSLGGFIILVSIVVCAFALLFNGWKMLVIILGIVGLLIIVPPSILSLFSATLPIFG